MGLEIGGGRAAAHTPTSAAQEIFMTTGEIRCLIDVIGSAGVAGFSYIFF